MWLKLGLSMMLFCAFSLRAEECYLTPGWRSMEVRAVDISRGTERETIEYSIRVADSGDERAAGYQWICEVDARDTAVLFVFPGSVSSAFHMKNVSVPLDIHFFDENGRQVDALVMRPEPPGSGLKPRYYRPSGSFRYALEIVQPHSHDLESTPAPLRLHVDSLQ